MQIIVIHGGETFDTHDGYLAFLKNWQIDFARYRPPLATDWKRGLGAALGAGYEVIQPDMPNKLNAKYSEWKIWFEKFIPYFEPQVALVGHSLGGIFLVKYLSENDLPKKIAGLFLVAACYDGVSYEGETIESLGDFKRTQPLDGVVKQADKIFLYHSRDDRSVPFADFERYQKDIPSAVSRVFENRGHINQESFPELVGDIKSLS